MNTQVAELAKRLIMEDTSRVCMNLYATTRAGYTEFTRLHAMPVLAAYLHPCRSVCCIAGHLAADKHPEYTERELNQNAAFIAAKALDLTMERARILFNFHNLDYDSYECDSDLLEDARKFVPLREELEENHPGTLEYAQVVCDAIDLAVKLWGNSPGYSVEDAHADLTMVFYNLDGPAPAKTEDLVTA